jgi:septal ring-binding cell division protein DamX
MPEISLISGLVLIVIAVAWTFVQRSDVVSERLRQWLPGGAGQQMSQPAGNLEQSSHRASAPAVAESAQTDHQAAPVADASSSAGADELPPASVAAGSGTQALAVSAPPPMAIASGGSRLVLSDSLSQPPPSDAPMVQQTSTAAPDAMGSATGAEQRSSAGLAAMPEQAAEPVAVVVAAASIDPEVMVQEAMDREAMDRETMDQEAMDQEAVDQEAVDQEAVDQEAVETVASPMEESSVQVGEALGPLTEARLVATRDWLQAADEQHFSIQLLLTDFARRANLEKFLRERQSAGEVEDYFVFETRIRSNIWYGVLYKEYPSFAAAKAALEELPEEFRYHQPFIRNVRDIATLG